MNTLNETLAIDGRPSLKPNEPPTEQELNFLFAGDLAGGLRSILQLGVEAAHRKEHLSPAAVTVSA